MFNTTTSWLTAIAIAATMGHTPFTNLPTEHLPSTDLSVKYSDSVRAQLNPSLSSDKPTDNSSDIEAAQKALADNKAIVAEKQTALEEAKKDQTLKAKNLENAKKALDTVQAQVKSRPEIKFDDPALVKKYLQGWQDKKIELGDREFAAEGWATYMNTPEAVKARAMIEKAFDDARYETTMEDRARKVDANHLTDEQLKELTEFGNSVVNSMRKNLGTKPVRTHEVAQEFTAKVYRKNVAAYIDGKEVYGEFNHKVHILDSVALEMGLPGAGGGVNLWENLAGSWSVGDNMASLKMAIYKAIELFMTNDEELNHATSVAGVWASSVPNNPEDYRAGAWYVIAGNDNTNYDLVGFEQIYKDDLERAGKDVSAVTTVVYDNANLVQDAARLQQALNTAQKEYDTSTKNLTTKTKELDTAKQNLKTAETTLNKLLNPTPPQPNPGTTPNPGGSGSVPNQPNTPGVKTAFTDIASYPFVKEINWLADSGVTTGYPDKTFRPHDSVSRAAMAAFIYRLEGKPAYEAPKQSPFKDIKPGDDFYKEICWLASKGITTGYADGTFKPWDPIARDAMAAFLHRYDTKVAAKKLPLKLAAKNFTDTASTPFAKDIAWLSQTGVTTGYQDGSFRPFENIERGAIAAFFYRMKH